MNVLVATDGRLDPAAAADAATRLAGEEGRITVLTVVEVPRGLLADLRAVYGESHEPQPIDQNIEYAGHTTARSSLSPSWPGDEEMIKRYIENQTHRRTADLVEALRHRGAQPEVVTIESENVAGEILSLAAELHADFICVGTHGQGAFDGLMGSTSTKVSRRAHCAVVLLRTATTD
jgi:nucleotide-binding universal stress UspA family protein